MLKKTLAAAALALCLLSRPACAFDPEGMQTIGDVASVSRDATGVTLSCRDSSRVRLQWLAPDLVRVRMALGHDFPSIDHSWAIAKTSWPNVPFTVEDTPTRLTLKSSELRVVVEKSPLRIEFQDAAGHTVNRDHLPAMWDAKGAHNAELFDPKSGPMVAVTKDLGVDEHFYGLGEKANHLDKRRESFTMWNSDTPGYKPGRDPLYQSIPFYEGLQNGRAYGIFYDNSYKSRFDFATSTQEYISFSAEGGEVNYYFFWGPSLAKVIGRYTELTGRMPMPPRWALGHQASRWSYYPDKMVKEIASTYQSHDLPLDVMTLDIDYMQKYRVFTWDRQRFPDPDGLSKWLKERGLKLITIMDPGVKWQPTDHPVAPGPHPETDDQSSSYYVFNQGRANHYFITHADGSPMIPKVWPGDSAFVDFTLENARKWWGDLHRAYTDHGVDGIWNDMNEPSDFVDQTGAHQREAVNDDLGQKTRHAKNRNVFALLEARATYEGLSRLRPDERPFVITRAAYAGIQRYSSMWTGDAFSSWDNYAAAIPMFTSLGLSGESFIGCDVGGFVGRADGEMLTRAYQICFLIPFCRNHKQIDAYDQEPWRFGPYYESIIRRYLKLRYRLMPYLYGEMEEAHRTGLPPIRPLVLSDQSDPQTWNLDDEFTVGRDLLLAPVTLPESAHRHVYLPRGQWYDFWSGARHAGGQMIDSDAPLEKMPFFVRGGSVIPMGPERNTTNVRAGDPLTLCIYPDADGSAHGSLYEDDGHTLAYSHGAYARRSVNCHTGVVEVGAAEGSYRAASRPLQIVWKGEHAPRSARLDGRDVPLATLEGSPAVVLTDDGRAHRVELTF